MKIFNNFGVANIFPIKVFRFDCSHDIDGSYVDGLTRLIDDEISEGYYWSRDDSPKYQTSRNLFELDNASLIRDLFKRAAYLYMVNSPDTFNRDLGITISDCNGWGYRSNSESNGSEDRGPWHNHNPSPITGVFYLKMPSDDNTCGTEFYNPLGMLKSSHDVTRLDPINLNWLIFPGWLQHRSIMSHSQEYRYVIAADCFLKYS